MPTARLGRSAASPTLAVVVAAVAAAVLAAAPAPARAERAADRSGSPVFVVEGATRADTLPLESTRADVAVAGVIADVVVRQTYRNAGDAPITARYVFPASTRAAVHGMRMTIGDRVIEARIAERAEARAGFEAARAAGKTASLLEEERPNVFTMRVANILPGERVQVELRYSEHLVATAGVYELVYPAVVGPRYAGAAGTSGDGRGFLTAPHRPAGAPPAHAFDVAVSIAGGVPVRAVESPSHAIATRWSADHARADVALAPAAAGAGVDPAGGRSSRRVDSAGAAAGDRDFVLRYRLAGERLASGLLLHRGTAPGDDGYFLLTVQPPQRPTPAEVPPREYVFVVDVSGSMHGFPLDTTKLLMRDLLGGLRPEDRFDVLLFSGGSSLYADRSVAATPDRIADAIAFVDRTEGGGGTELLAALQRALALPTDGAIARSVVVVTDGYIAEEPAAFEHVRRNLGRTSVFAFGIGSSVNRHLIEGLARAGQGEPFVVLDPAEAAATAARFRDYVERPVLTGVTVAYEGFGALDVEPRAVPDVFAARPIVVFGKFRGDATGRIRVSGVTGNGRFVDVVDVAAAAPRGDHPVLARLWARGRIARLDDEGAEANRAAITALGLRHGLLTSYTSFLAVDQRVRTGGAGREVDHVLPMPAGVEDTAFAEGPEPPLAVLLALVGLGLAFAAWRRRAAAA